MLRWDTGPLPGAVSPNWAGSALRKASPFVDRIFLARAFFGIDFFLAETLLFEVFVIDLSLVDCIAVAFFWAMVGNLV